MKEQKGCFVYSKKNKYPLDIPDDIMMKLEKQAPGKRKKTKEKRPFDFMRVIRIVAFFVLAVSVVVFGERMYEYTRDIKYSDAQNHSISVDAAYTGLEAEKRETPVYPEFEGQTVETGRFDYPKITDSESLQQFSMAYPDFVFWIYIENTYVNYPVVQAADNDYYLRRNMDGETNIAGTLFLDFRCDRETFKRHNIVYGHNNQNGHMFGPLKNYLTKSYFNEHQIFYTYTKDSVTMWKVFSAYETDTSNYYIETRFKTDEDYLKFLQKLQKDSKYKTDVQLTAQDDILTLSTCHLYTNVNGRLVVHAVKVAETPLA